MNELIKSQQCPKCGSVMHRNYCGVGMRVEGCEEFDKHDHVSCPQCSLAFARMSEEGLGLPRGKKKIDRS